MRNVKWVMLSLLLVSCAIDAASEKKETDEAKALRFIELLEIDPLADDADVKRSWVMNWLVKTPDYHVLACDILKSDKNKDKPYFSELFVQQLYGNAAYQIKHHDVTDQITLQVEGVKSMLKAYREILRKDKSSHIAYFDELVEKLEDGKLKESLAESIKKNCKEGK